MVMAGENGGGREGKEWFLYCSGSLTNLDAGRVMTRKNPKSDVPHNCILLSASF